MISSSLKRVIAVLIFMMVYFTIFINFSDTIVSWFNAFIDANGSMFVFNTTKTTYSFDPSTNQIVSNKTVETVDYRPVLIFIFYIVVYFVIPILIPLYYLSKGLR